jgi:hypothetical protein
VEDAAYAAEICLVEVLQEQNAQVAAGAQYSCIASASKQALKS